MTGIKHFAKHLCDLFPFKQPVYTALRASKLIAILNEDIARQVNALLAGSEYRYYIIDEIAFPVPRVQAISKSGFFNYLPYRPDVAEAIGIWTAR